MVGKKIRLYNRRIVNIKYYNNIYYYIIHFFICNLIIKKGQTTFYDKDTTSIKKTYTFHYKIKVIIYSSKQIFKILNDKY